MHWNDIINNEINKPYYSQLSKTLKNEYQNYTIYPPKNMITNALDLTPIDNVKCVIIGQDPYHGENQAMGLSFSVQDGVAIPPSLKNIYAEIQREYGYPIPTTGNLTKWAKQGVLLLNNVLTVRAGQPNSHKNIGWENYTNAIIQGIETLDRPIVYMLWGRNAQEKKSLIINPKHLILESAHPSPYSVAGFTGNNHFIKCNEFLSSNNITEIDWRI